MTAMTVDGQDVEAVYAIVRKRSTTRARAVVPQSSSSPRRTA